MVSSIGGSTLAQSLLARVQSRSSQEVQAAGAGTATAVASATAGAGTTDEDGAAGAVTRSALSSATDRLGEQLAAQADATRLREASGEDGEVPPAPPEGMAPQGPPPSAGIEGEIEPGEDSGGTGADATISGAATAQAGAAGGAAPAGGASSSSESDDYIAEADTNSDRKVSDEERAAYEKKLKAQAGKSTQEPQDAAPAERSRAQEVQQAYAPQESESSLSTTA